MSRAVCRECKQREVEVIDEWESNFCCYCNDRMIERSNKRREWDYYHPGVKCPPSELE